MTRDKQRNLINYLEKFISDNKKSLIEEKLGRRTRYITVVLEDIYNPHNASAVIRSCECFGIQDLHVVEKRNKYRLNPGITRGSSKWISLFQYNNDQDNNTDKCIRNLKNMGYRLVAATPDHGSIPVNEYKLKSPVALFFGTEMKGLSDKALNQMDETIHIPIRGFTESFNISVSVALCLYEFTKKLATSNLNWLLNKAQMDELRIDWYKKVIKKSVLLEKEFFNIHK